MTERTLTAMYDTRGAAETARDGLGALGIPADAISIRGSDGDAGAGSAGEDRGFWASLSDLFMPDEDRRTYAEGLSRGSYLLTARVPESTAEQALDVLERSDPIDIDERAASWREGGWTGDQTGAGSGVASASYSEGAGLAEAGTAYAADDVAPTRQGIGTDRSGAADLGRSDASLGTTGDETVQVVEEDLRVGKREVGGGRVRVRSYVTERPVEEQVELRQEHVTIERRPVDRELTSGDAAFQERTIEAVERGEEAVVSKTAHVTEEIGLRKDVERETETIRDTVRKQDVEIEDERAPRKPTGTGTVVEDSVVDPDLAGTSR